MVQRITTFAFDGIDAKPVDVQVQLMGGQPHFSDGRAAGQNRR